VNVAALAGEHRRLLRVELAARDLASFSTSDPSISTSLRLPDWENSDRMAWPPPKTPLALLVAASVMRSPDPAMP
jgi:hypothetical protein